MVSRWFLWAIYLIIAGTCAMLIPDEIDYLLKRFGQLQMHPALQSNLKKLLALEILSFVSLFGIGAILLGYHRFEVGIFVFAVGSVVIAASCLLAVFGLRSKVIKLVLVIFVYALAIVGCEYLMGIVEQAQSEYYADLEEKEKDHITMAFLRYNYTHPQQQITSQQLAQITKMLSAKPAKTGTERPTNKQPTIEGDISSADLRKKVIDITERLRKRAEPAENIHEALIDDPNGRFDPNHVSDARAKDLKNAWANDPDTMQECEEIRHLNNLVLIRLGKAPYFLDCGLDYPHHLTNRLMEVENNARQLSP